MSDEISMAEKLNMVRTALPQGLSAGSARATVNSGYTSPQGAIFREPLRADTTMQQGNFNGPDPFQDSGTSQTSEGVEPPFWPTLRTSNGGATFFFTITDGFVVDHRGGNGNNGTSAVAAPYYPSGISLVFSGDRTEVAITPGQQISIKVVILPDGDVSTVSMVVEAEDANSFNPDPTASVGVGIDGEFHYKIAVLRPAVGNVPAYLNYYLAGSHIYLRHRGHNLDQRVYNVNFSSCTGLFTSGTNHYLCWRNGDYVGKFLSTDTLPTYTGALDASSVTHLTFT